MKNLKEAINSIVFTDKQILLTEVSKMTEKSDFNYVMDDVAFLYIGMMNEELTTELITDDKERLKNMRHLKEQWDLLSKAQFSK